MDASEEKDDSEARARFDSRLLQRAEEIEQREAPRYLGHNAPAGLSFDEAFAHIRHTESFTNPPSIPELPNATPTPAPAALAASVAPAIPRARDGVATVFVNRCQTGNPLLKSIKNVGTVFRDGMVPDYVMENTDGTSTCVLFLSVRYHLLHNMYLEERLNRIKKEDVVPYKTRVVLCLVDVDDNEIALREINRLVLLSQFTLLLSWSWPEAARYIETLKAYENKSASMIKEKVECEFLPKANDVLTSIRSVNKTDVVTLLSTFGTISSVMGASMEELSLCPGIGAKKVKQLLDTFNEPFAK
ncbi:TPA: hypothetical protein N0F65_000680 [Lagenidium giganteum]|uniref:ERCC1-like central domain-containing protein n=1 Tax=Lagenidium giganteum TaxID=4803 RepID=A0AAV2YYL3_9STRA|nr:TPA: hypothetical protein N0F65_000680 [Lagenidium giganteum]